MADPVTVTIAAMALYCFIGGAAGILVYYVLAPAAFGHRRDVGAYDAALDAVVLWPVTIPCLLGAIVASRLTRGRRVRLTGPRKPYR